MWQPPIIPTADEGPRGREGGRKRRRERGGERGREMVRGGRGMGEGGNAPDVDGVGGAEVGECRRNHKVVGVSRGFVVGVVHVTQPPRAVHKELLGE